MLRPYYTQVAHRPGFSQLAPAHQFAALLDAIATDYPTRATELRGSNATTQSAILGWLHDVTTQKPVAREMEMWRVRKGDRELRAVAVYLATGIDLRLLEKDNFRRTGAVSGWSLAPGSRSGVAGIVEPARLGGIEGAGASFSHLSGRADRGCQVVPVRRRGNTRDRPPETMLVWKLVTGVSWSGWCTGLALYYAVGVFFVWIYTTLFPGDSLARVSSPASMAFGMSAGFNWGMTLAVPIFMARRVRAVGVLVLTATVLASLGARMGQQAGISELLVAVVAGALGWPLLQGIGALYQRRLISEQSLLVDSIWLLYGAMTSMFAWEGGLLAVVPAAFVPFVVFKVVSQVGFAHLRRVPAPQPCKLLLLRVFALGDRSRQLFRSLAMPWRYTGPIRLITGPDLATETVEPNEFLDFMGRRLSKHFIDSADTLARRVRELESVTGFDRLYRVDELFCHDDTWAMALRALIH